MAGGYAGKFLRVDLSKGSWDDFTIADDVLRQYIGGSCLAAKLFLERYPIEADPLSPENPLMIMTGPMVGSGFPGTSRFSVCAKSPQTGIWAESACGGTFGPELKRAGYDGIVIEGRSEKPVVLSIIDSKIALSDASSLWGKDIYEATDELKAADAGVRALEAKWRLTRSNRMPLFYLAGALGYAHAGHRTDQTNPFVVDNFNYFRLGAFLGVSWNFNLCLL